MRKTTVLFIILLIAAGIVGYMMLQTGKSGVTVCKEGKEYSQTINRFSEGEPVIYGFSSFTSGTFEVTVNADRKVDEDFLESFTMEIRTAEDDKTLASRRWDEKENGLTCRIGLEKMKSYNFVITAKSYNDQDLIFKIEKMK